MSTEEKKNIIIDYIKRNPKATYKEIRKDIKIHPERVFKNGIKEAFEQAGVKPPRTFEIKTKEEKRKIIIDYIRKNPRVGGHTIRKETKINFFTLFKDTEEAFEEAGVIYPREVDKRNKKEKSEEIIRTIKENPFLTINELIKKTKTKPYNFFKSIKELYSIAKINNISRHEKIKFRKRKEVINFIKNTPFATQREINQNCRTHVRDLFNNGIFGAYKEADIEYPYERLIFYGTALKDIKKRAEDFETKIAIELSGYGKVNRLVKTKRGFVDIILERKDKKAIIEVKDYEKKEVSVSQVRQLNKYLEDCNCNLGFLVCAKKPVKDKFLIGKNQIFVLESSEISKIPEIMGS